MLKGGDGAQAGGLLQLLNELPGVQRVQKIDVAGTAVENGDGQIGTVGHVDFRGLLVGIAAVFQFKFVHVTSLLYWCLFTMRCSYSRVSRSV